jgi:hypothetical protein
MSSFVHKLYAESQIITTEKHHTCLNNVCLHVSRKKFGENCLVELLTMLRSLVGHQI